MSAFSRSASLLTVAAALLVAPLALAQTEEDTQALDQETAEDVDRQIDGLDSEIPVPPDPPDAPEPNTELWEEYQRYRGDRDPDREYKSSGERVNFGDDVTVLEGERIEGDVVSIGGDAIIFGSVIGDVVSVGGSVILEEGAIVDGDVVSVGGRVDKRGAVEVSGETVSIDLGFNIFSRGVKHGDWHMPDTRYFSLGFELAWLVVGLLIGLIFYAIAPNRLETISRRIEAEPGQSFLIGLVGALGTPIAIVLAIILLAITIIGILLIPVLLFAVVLMVLGGFFAVSLAVGRRVAHLRESGELQVARSPYFYLFIGYIALNALDLTGSLLGMGGGFLSPLSTMLSVVGCFVILFGSILGYGALLTSRFGRQAVPANGGWPTTPGSAPPPPGELPSGHAPPPPPPPAAPSPPPPPPASVSEPPDEERPST
jgi:carbonic anhydrase/acetyltransferase-like protein (isoleucine patch superfamily)